MVRAYNLAYRPVLKSRHADGRAIDMTIANLGNTLRLPDGSKVRIGRSPHTGIGVCGGLQPSMFLSTSGLSTDLIGRMTVAEPRYVRESPLGSEYALTKCPPTR